MKKTNIDSGITLIALIITIAILLILSAVILSNNNGKGIMNHAKNQKSEITNKFDNMNKDMKEYRDFLESD